MLDFLPVLVVFAICTLVLLITRFGYGVKTRDLPYPPGPPPRFFVGNLFEVPRTEPYLEYLKWSRMYKSDLVSFQIPGSPRNVVVNSAQAWKALFEQKSSIYSDRPATEINKLAGWDFSFAMIPYSDTWRAHRRIAQQLFRPNAVKEYRPALESRVRRLLTGLDRCPEDAVRRLEYHAGAFPMKLMYGREVDSVEDPLILQSREAVDLIADKIFPGTVLMDILPPLRYLPKWVPGLRGYSNALRRCRVLTSEILNGPFNNVKRNMDHLGSPESDSLLASILRQRKGGVDYDEDLVKAAFATLNVAALDTSMSASAAALLAFVLHPSVQHRAQSQIDTIVGRQRLPNFSDQDDLPYITAICREILRWLVIVPLGLVHAVTEDDVYEGYFIPKGSIVTGNAWAILHDPSTYPDPESFIPERFITPDGKLSDDNVLPAFGFARRICPGRYLAEDALWIVVASILAVFDVVKAKDENGNEIDVVPKQSDSTIRHPLPFPCVVLPRDEHAKALIKGLDEENLH